MRRIKLVKIMLCIGLKNLFFRAFVFLTLKLFGFSKILSCLESTFFVSRGNKIKKIINNNNYFLKILLKFRGPLCNFAFIDFFWFSFRKKVRDHIIIIHINYTYSGPMQANIYAMISIFVFHYLVYLSRLLYK